MSIAILLAVMLGVQTPAVPAGIIAGKITPPENLTISTPIRIVLLPAQYATAWETDVQRRLDAYWEQYRQAFAERKEFFLEVSRLAHREALTYVLTQMRRDTRPYMADLVRDSAPDGSFEFKNVPVGDYRAVAVGRIG